MVLRLKRNESMRHGAKRIVRKQLNKALEEIAGSRRKDQDSLIHAVRKRLKKIRGVLRLVRDGMERKSYRRENRRFRDMALPLREPRDAKVLVEAFDRLRDAHAKRLKSRGVQALRRDLAKHQAADKQDLIDSTAEVLRIARRKIRKWQIARDSWSIIGNGIRRVYEAGYMAFHSAETDPSIENLHEWRKQTKYCRTVLEVLEKILGRSRSRDRLIGELKVLAQCLGDDHDLALLAQRVEANKDVGDVAREELVTLIRRRREELERQAFLQGRRAFRKRPGPRLRSWNKSWRTHRSKNKRS